MSAVMPLFTIKAKDALALPTIEAYHRECIRRGLDGQASEVLKALLEIMRWQADNADRVQAPDHAHVPADPRPAAIAPEYEALGPDSDGDRPFWCVVDVDIRYESGRGGDTLAHCRRFHPEAIRQLYIAPVAGAE